MKFIHACCVGESHTSYRVLAMRDLRGDAQDFMREEFRKMEAHREVKIPQAQFTVNSVGQRVALPTWTAQNKIVTASLVGFIATWSIDLTGSEMVNLDFSSESGCWDRRKKATAVPQRPRGFY